MKIPKLEIAQLRMVAKTFDLQVGLAPLWLILGGAFMSIAELIGVSAVFPIIIVIMNPQILANDNILGQIYYFLGINNPKHFIALMAAGTIAIFAGKAIFNIIYLHYQFQLLAKWRTQIAIKFYEAYINSPYTFFIHKDSSAIVTIITANIPNLVNHYIYPFINLLSYLLISALLIGYVLYINWVAALTAVIIGGSILTIQSGIYRKKIRRMSEEATSLQKKQYALVHEGFGGFKEIRLNAKEDFFTAQFLFATTRFANIEQEFLFLRTLPSITVEIFAMLAVVLAFGVLLLTGGQLDLVAAQLGVMAMAGVRLIPLVNRSITSLMIMHGGKHAIEIVLDEYIQIPKDKNSISSKEPFIYDEGIKLEDVSYSYSGSQNQILKNVNFSVRPGEFVGVTGPSGSGKSTLAHVLLGLITDYTGTFIVDGNIIDRHNVTRLHKLIGFVDQQIFVMDSTIAENVAFGTNSSDIDRDRVVECLKKAQIWDFVACQKEGIDTKTGELGRWLSGGQRQRLGIARALYRDLKILILDEASSSLDLETEHRLFLFLNELKGDISVVMIAHRLSTLKDCDRVDFMDEGKIVDSGNFHELYKKNEKFRSYIDYSQIEHSNGN